MIFFRQPRIFENTGCFSRNNGDHFIRLNAAIPESLRKPQLFQTAKFCPKDGSP